MGTTKSNGGRAGFVAGAALVLAAFAAPGCSGDGSSGTGSVAIRISGEQAAKTGYPTEKNGHALAFVDGWRVTFSKFVVSIGRFSLRDDAGETAFESSDVFVADLTQGDPELFVRQDLPAKRFSRFSFEITPATADAQAAGALAPADLAAMAAEGLTYLVEGEATKGAEAVRFSWHVVNPSRNANCTSGTDGTDGVVVRSNTTVSAEVTVHADHIFWDSLGGEGARLRFDAIAATRADDRAIAFDDLASQPLANLKGLDGGPLLDEQGNVLIYDPGSVPVREPNLREFVRASMTAQAHFNGIGLCTVTAL